MNTTAYEREFSEILKKARFEFELIKSQWSDEVQKKFYEEYVANFLAILQQHLQRQMQI